MKNKIPLNKLSRGAVIGKTLVKVGVKHSSSLIKRKFLKKEDKEQIKKQNHEKIAKIVIEALGELKGISVKIAQQVALAFPFLPKECMDELYKSFNAIPQINKALIRKIIKQELKAYPNEVFDEFNSSAFAAASLGQVHKAKIKDKNFAVKIQYPGIAKTIDNDLYLLNYAFKKFAKGQDISPLSKEIEQRLKEEVDYEIEAENTKYFYKNLKDEALVIPKINTKLSTKKVLVSNFIKGDSFKDFLEKNHTQETKNYYAQKIFDTFFICLYELKMIHADPNPGNFLFLEDKKLALIDFGCVKKLDNKFLLLYSKLHQLLIQKAKNEELIALYEDIEMIHEKDKNKKFKFYEEVIKPLDQIYIEIFENDTYDFKENCDFSKRGFLKILEVQKKQFNSVDKFNPEYIFINRTLLGYYAIFEKMQAKINTSFAKKFLLKKD